MQNGKLISVIVPVYNAEKYLDYGVKSLLNQVYENFELILINDGSKDNSLEICRKYERQDKRVRVFDKQNGGVSSARNAGLDNCKGDYIIFVDSDDSVSPNYLSNLLSVAQLDDYDIVQCLTKRTDIQGRADVVEFSKKDILEMNKAEALNSKIYSVSSCAKLYKAELFDEFRFTEGIIHEDDDSCYQLANKAQKIAILKKHMYFYYMSANSIMRNNNDKRLDFVDIYKRRIEFFKLRNEKELLDGSYNRYCIVLMVFLSAAFSKKHNLSDWDMLQGEFNQAYKKVIKSKYVSFGDKFVLTAFRTFPKLSGRLIYKLRGKKSA